MSSPEPPRLDQIPWSRAAEHFRRDARLILPVGSLLQHGPHLPLGTDSLIVTRLAEAIAARHEIMLAPTLPFGAGSERDREYAGSACLRGPSLRRILNDLVRDWRNQGVMEFILMTAHGFGPHLQALATVVSERARVRVVDLHAIDLSEFLDDHQGGEHAGELATSLVLHLAPERVESGRAEDLDLPPEAVRSLRSGEEPVAPPGSDGLVGFPSRGSARKGRAIFEYLVRHIGNRLASRERTDVG